MRANIDVSKDLEGELYDQYASYNTQLNWSGFESNILLNGASDLTVLKNIKNVLLLLQQQFNSSQGPRIIFQSQRRDDFSKRLLLMQAQLDGLLRKRINYSVNDQVSGQRNLDYTNLLNEKQNQIVQLEKKINNFEQRLRRMTKREIQLQNHIENLNKRLNIKDNIINAKNQVILSEVASTNAMRQCITRLKRNIQMNRSKLGDLERIIFDGVIMPDVGIFQIKTDALTKDGALGRSKTYFDSTQGQKLKTKIIQMIRQFERLFGNPNAAQEQVERIILNLLTQFKNSSIYQDTITAQKRIKIEQDYKRLRQNFAAAGSIYQQNLQQLRIDNPNIRINLQQNLFDILQRQKVEAFKTQKGAIFVSDFSQRTIQIPVQDARTKHLVHLFASQLKRLFMKYPKLQTEINEKVAQFFQQQIIELIEVDEVDRLVEIVKYVPQVVKVQNVYAFSSQKTRKIQFHLRVLIKALLEQLQKMKRKSGIVPEMDQGVIGMIKQQIMGVVNVDDILKVFRVVPKIVQVQKIVQKVVERLVQVPQVITIDRIVQKIVQVQKIRQVQKIVNVPLQQPVMHTVTVQKIVPVDNIIERVVQVPTIVQKLVQVVKQVTNTIQVQRYQDRIVQIQKIVQVQRVVNHIQKQYQQIQLIHQRIVPVQKITQKIVEVPIIIEKIVQKIVQIPRIVQVQKVIEKIVPVIEYRNARQVQNHIQIQYQIVERIVQKPVPIIQTVERVVQVPQIVEKIVQVLTIEEKIVQKEVIRQRIVIQQKIKQVQKIITKPVQIIKQVPRQIEKVIQVPFIHQKLVKVQQFIQKPIIQTIQTTKVKQVYLRDPIIIRQPRIIEVQKIINHYIEVPRPFRYIQEKIVEVPRIIDRIKEVRVEVDKLVQKMVEVPKVVEVQKLVQKIVVVPRVIEKVIQIPQIIQKVVQKQVIKQIIREVQRKVQVPVIQQKPVQIEAPRNVYIQTEKVVQRIVQKLVQVPRLQQIVQIKQIIKEKVIEIVKQIPRVVQVQKIVTLFTEQLQVIQVQKPIIIPIEVPVPTERIVEKLVVKEDVIEKIVTVPQLVQKVVAVRHQQAVIHQIQKIVQKVVVEQKIKQVQKLVPYFQQVIKQVPNIIQKIVPVYTKVQQIKTAQLIVEKVVQRVITIPKVYQIQKIREIMVQVPKFIQIDRIVPQLVKVNNYIQKIVEKIVEVPIIIQQLKQVQKEVEKVIKVETQIKQVVPVQQIVEKVVVMQKMKQVVRNINHIEKVLQIIQRLQQLPPVQITSRQQIILQVPYIMEKIVQKIVVMPQIVQVLKYIHQITEKEDIGVAVDVQTSTYEQKYKLLSKNIKSQLDVFLRELRAMKNPQFKARIDIIQKFLMEFDGFILNPRIIKIPQKQLVEKKVQVEKIVQVPTQSQKSLRMQLTLSILVQKLIMELKRIKTMSKIQLQLDEDVKLIFFSELGAHSKLQGAFSQQISSYSNKLKRQFQSLGSWTSEQNLMLNSFLQQRFLMAQLVHNANLQIQKALNIGQKRLQGLRRYKKDRNAFEGYLVQISQIMNGLNNQIRSQLGAIYGILSQFQNYSHDLQQQPARFMGELIVQDQRIQSLLRQKQQQIYRLKDLLHRSGVGLDGKLNNKNIFDQLNNLKMENGELRALVRSLQGRIGLSDIQAQISPFKSQIKELQQQNLKLQNLISMQRSNVINLTSQNKVLKELIGDKGLLSENSSVRSSTIMTAQFGGAQGSVTSGSNLYSFGPGTGSSGQRQLFTQTQSMLLSQGGTSNQSKMGQSGGQAQRFYSNISPGNKQGEGDQRFHSQFSNQGVSSLSGYSNQGTQGSILSSSGLRSGVSQASMKIGNNGQGVQGSTYTSSNMKSSQVKQDLIARSPEGYKQYQTPSSTAVKMESSRVQRSPETSLSSSRLQFGTPSSTWKKQQQKKDETGKK